MLQKHHHTSEVFRHKGISSAFVSSYTNSFDKLSKVKLLFHR